MTNGAGMLTLTLGLAAETVLLALTAPEASHMAVEVAFVLFLVFAAGVMFFNTMYIRGLLVQGQVDRAARDQAITSLLRETTALAEKAAEATKVNETYLRGLHDKIDANTEMTKVAASASSDAASAASSVLAEVGRDKS